MTKTKTPPYFPSEVDQIADRLYARFIGEGVNCISQELRLRLFMEQSLRPDATVPFGLDRLDVWATADYLGLSPDTLRDRTKRRKLGMPQPFSIGKKLQWRRSELDVWVDQRRTKSMAA